MKVWWWTSLIGLAPAWLLAQAPPPLPAQDAQGRYQRRAETGHVTNYREDAVPPYVLPDPLVLHDGQPVTDAATWFGRRRPELLRDYEREIFGRVPATAPTVRFEVAEEAPALDGRAVRSRIVARFGQAPREVAVNFVLYTPVRAAGPVPVVLHLSFGGDPGLPGRVRPRGMADNLFNDLGPVDEMIARGYGYAIVHYKEIQPDRAGAEHEGVIGLALPAGQAAPAPDEWGGIAAWSWGLSRFLDYLGTRPGIDATRVAVVGHSRLGKTALWAGASDPRFALIYSSQSGEMGAALSRRDYGETVDDIAPGLAHEFARNFQKYVGRWNDLPHEAHLLIALSAPRPVLITAADGDPWSDPRGQFLAVVAAGPVWRLLGKSDLGTTVMPPLDMPVATGSLAFLENHGEHVISALDWKTFLEFADRHLVAEERSNK
jgi:hypothetical protein